MNSFIKIKKLGILLRPTDYDFERKAVLNPGCYQEGEFVHLYYRAIDEKNKSTIGYAKLKGPMDVVERWKHPIISRSYNYEKHGVEDPRVVKIGKNLYMTYVAHDGKNAVTALAVSQNLVHFKKKGVISPKISYDRAAWMFRKEKLKDKYFMFEALYEEYAGKDVLLWSKDIFFFPEKINDRYVMVQRILPDIQILYFHSFSQLKQKAFWMKYLKKLSHFVILENKYCFESRNIGGGAPPIKTKDGWLLIFHTVEELNKARTYHASAALLELKNPKKVISRMDRPLFSPEEEWEKHGHVDNVVFPSGTAVFGKDLYIYYGATDKVIGVAKVNINELIRYLKKKRRE